MTGTHRSPGGYVYAPGYCAVVLLDVMGIKADLASISAWPKTEQELADYRQKLLACAAKRDSLRRRFETVFPRIFSGPIDIPSGIGDEVAEEIRQHFSRNVVHTQTFSDTVIAFTRLDASALSLMI